MFGHTLLHIAATQNNVQVLQYLTNCRGVKLNQPDQEYRKTPLYCTKRTCLMATEAVDVSDQLARSGICKRPSWLLPASKFALTGD
ncbi:hypothetical protein Mapa_012571 [Marchantia paleacea]|nr:hypothetical protein Mapa_012571 [Marchantia paleacea]